MKKSFKIIFIVTFIIGLFLFGVSVWIYSIIPDRKQLTSCMITRMYKVTLCPGTSSYIPLNQISKFMQKAVVLTEDSRFFEHKGFDWESIEKSAKENLAKGKIKRGGSTITQQLAKNLYLTKDKSMVRKIAEAFITIQIEKYLTKKEILEKYLNVIEFGQNIYGIKAAARHYFDKTPAQLDVIESAFLAMLLPNPVKYSRSFKSKQLTPFAYSRVKTIIENLYQYNRITEADYVSAAQRLEFFLSKDEKEKLEAKSAEQMQEELLMDEGSQGDEDEENN
ncbi:MAG: monofunctional biosynthetic peptidoglycan transglycosylase [Bdellovibrionaceae bacterium]|nr:monofunctional biosynthetic peptidoglycan transglycosylase [Pseudobdellovibrionaceae bacterium]NUM57635.1 monofunctional biosynthetic peptidoglycan transglycosylase [Pseudobdellovibrionaceae bacterium]